MRPPISLLGHLVLQGGLRWRGIGLSGQVLNAMTHTGPKRPLLSYLETLIQMMNLSASTCKFVSAYRGKRDYEV